MDRIKATISAFIGAARAVFSGLVQSRMSGWLAISIALMLLVAAVEPQKIPLYVYKANLIAFAAWMGYWIDRGLFPYARPDRVSDSLGETAQIRRALIIAASILAMALGL